MKKTKKILLAAGIFYPDVGGPAIHVRKIAERLVTEGFDVTVLAYGDDPQSTPFSFRVQRVTRRYPKIFQWVVYLIHAIHYALFADVVYAFDPTSAGMPACIVAKIFNKPFLIRVGGDPIWEREAEEGRIFMSMNQYYEKGLYKKDKPMLFKMIRYMLAQADALVLYNQAFKNFYMTYYGVDERKIHIVKNPVFKREPATSILSSDPIVLFAGRYVHYKNLPLVMKAFDAVRKHTGKGKLMLVGKGPDRESLLSLRNTLESKDGIVFQDSVPQETLFNLIRDSAVCLGPALSEFNPNFILESLSFGKPVLLSKGHGLSVDLPEKFLFDPFNQTEFEEKLTYLFNTENYAKAVEEIARIPLTQTWENVTDFHCRLIQDACQKQ